MVGHSLGEVAAAYVAGALGLDDAVRVMCQRSRLFKRTVGQGAMAAVDLSIEDARSVLVGAEDRVSIAVSNGPTSTVLSGDPAALAAILDRLQRRDIFCRMVQVDFASHSPQMEPLRADLLDGLEGLKPRAESVPIYSTVTGQIARGQDFDAPYWARNMREPVLFSAAVQRLVDDGHDIFLEISPHPILLSAMQQGFHHFGQDGAVLPSLRRDEDERAVMLGSLGALYCLGYKVDWALTYPTGGNCVRLPSYPWRRERFWHESAAADSDLRREHVFPSGTGNHPLLGRRFQSPHPAGIHFWEATLDRTSLPYLDDHRIQGVAVLPASAYLEMALAAAAEVFGAQEVALKDIEFRKALFLPEGATRTIQAILSQGADGTAFFHIYSRADGEAHSGSSWMLHATGKVVLQQDESIVAVHAGPETLADLRMRCAETTSGQDYYRKLGDSGIHYGPSFRGIARLWPNDGEMLGEVQAPDGPESDLDGVQIHPATIDAGLQVFAAAIASRATEIDRQGLYLPTRIDRFQVHGRPGRHLWGHARVQHRGADATTGDVRLLDDAGQAAVEIQGLHFEYLGDDTQRASVADLDDWLYEFRWQPKELVTGVTTAPQNRASWLIFADDGGVGDSLAALLAARGERSVLVVRGESYEQTDGSHYRIRSDRPEDIRRLFEATSAPDRPGGGAIVHLWSLDAADPEATTVASLNAAQGSGCANVLLLVQELARTEAPDHPRLWLMTRGAQAAGDTSSQVSVAQSPLWGLGRVIAQEHPTLWGGLIDLEPGASLHDAAYQVHEEISGADGEDQIAFCQGRRHVGRLVRKRPSATQAPPLRWRTDGSYLISGGLGDLGLLVARWMVEQGARRLILLGRTRLPPRADWSSIEVGSRLARQIAAIRDLESLGASVHLAPVDVADEDALSGFLDAFRAEGWPAIRGVVHAAGVLQDGLLVQLDATALHTVLRPKVMGGWLLHRLLEDDPLDFFVLFSSAGSVLGQPGQGNYAAGNAFLDALAHQRHAEGRPALSINWGAWAGEGFADSVGGKRLAARLALLGISSIAPKQALEMLGRLIGQSAPQVVAVPVDWRRYRAFYPAGNASLLFSELARDEDEVLRAAGCSSERRDAILAAEPPQRRQLLQSYLSEQVARVLGVSPSKLDVQQSLIHLGLDSLMAVELKNRIAVDLKVNVPIAKFLQGFSVDQAVAQVLDQLAEDAANPTMPLAPATARPGEQREAERLLASLDQLSDEQVGSLLADLWGEETAGSLPW